MSNANGSPRSSSEPEDERDGDDAIPVYQQGDDDNFPEQAEHLWVLAVSPTVWALHFLLCYISTAIVCAKMPGPADDIQLLRWAIAVVTALALAAIIAMAVAGWRRHTTGVDEPLPHREPKAGDRYRFIGFATLLLSGVSGVAVLYVAMAAMFFSSCR